jgi:hypothetical protein
METLFLGSLERIKKQVIDLGTDRRETSRNTGLSSDSHSPTNIPETTIRNVARYNPEDALDYLPPNKFEKSQEYFF